MNRSDRFEKQKLAEQLQNLLDDLKLHSQTIPIIVEGKADEKALRQLDIDGLIFRLNSAQPLFSICEKISSHYKEAIILTDWDRKGSKLCSSLKNAFAANGVKCNLDYRRKFAFLCKKEIKDVESLFKYMAKICGL